MAVGEVKFSETVLDDGRIEVSWEAGTPRDWQRILTLIKDTIPQNGRLFQKDSKKWLIAASYRSNYESIKASIFSENPEELAVIDEYLNDNAIANLMQRDLAALPKSMRRRANFAIKVALGMIDAPLEFCVSEGIFGAWSEEEGRWLYENGRYSDSSPSQRDDKVLKRAYKRLQSAIEGSQETLNLLDQEREEYWKMKFRRQMLEKYNYRCFICYTRPDQLSKLHMHRVIPGHAGGLYVEENVVLLCATCHRNHEGMSWAQIHDAAADCLIGPSVI